MSTPALRKKGLDIGKNLVRVIVTSTKVQELLLNSKLCSALVGYIWLWKLYIVDLHLERLIAV
jgi:hypothetical protein